MSRLQEAFAEQYALAGDRKINGGDAGSYTVYLYTQGLDKMLKKLGEECFEVCIAAKNGEKGELAGELNDALYHLTVLLCWMDISLQDLMGELCRRCRTERADLTELMDVIAGRREEADPNSYTAYLFRAGLDKILKKVGESCAALLISGKGQDREKVIAFSGELLYHLLVLMIATELPADVLTGELELRAGKTGNLKQFKQTDHTT